MTQPSVIHIHIASQIAWHSFVLISDKKDLSAHLLMEMIWICRSCCSSQHTLLLRVGMMTDCISCSIESFYRQQVIFQSWNHICFDNNWSDFSQSVNNKICFVTEVRCSHDGCAMRSLNFYHLLLAQSTVSRLFVKVHVAPPSHINASSMSSIDFVLTNALCMAHKNIACLYWDNDHFVGVPSFPLSRLNDVGNIVGRLAYFQLRCTHY